MKFKKFFIGLSIILTTVVYSEGFGGLKLPQQSFLTPDQAFKASVVKKDDSVNIKITLGEKIYIYAKDLHFKIINPVNKDISVKLPKSQKHGDSEVYRSMSVDIPLEQIESKVNENYTLRVEMTGCSDGGICYQPQTRDFNLTYSGEPEGIFSRIMRLVKDGNTAKISDVLTQESPIFIVVLFFIAGLLMALTPCILPMIPILSSIILQQANKDGEVKRATAIKVSLVYVISMAITYSLIGVVAGLLDFDIQASLNNPWVIIPMSGVFVALAFSLFGYYDMALPSAWQTKLNGISGNAQDKGLVGTAIMGSLSALIVGACTAPVISGAVLFIMLTGKAVLGGVALFFMGIGAGVPLLLVGAGASKLVPKPGGWMNEVSIFFGIIMLFMALYILDRLLPASVTMILVSLILMGWAFYMGALSHGSEASVSKKLIGFVVLLYGVILFIGAISGSGSISHPLEKFTTNRGITTSIDTSHISENGPQKDYSVTRLLKEVARASKDGKAVVVDISKDGCAACVELENITFPDSEVQEEMKRFKFIQIDITDNTLEDQELLKKYRLFGAPNILFFDSKGKPLPEKFYTGFIPPTQFAKQMRSIK